MQPAVSGRSVKGNFPKPIGGGLSRGVPPRRSFLSGWAQKPRMVNATCLHLTFGRDGRANLKVQLHSTVAERQAGRERAVFAPHDTRRFMYPLASTLPSMAVPPVRELMLRRRAEGGRTASGFSGFTLFIYSSLYFLSAPNSLTLPFPARQP